MNLIEITYPHDTLDETRRRAIADAILANYLIEPEAPLEAIERAGRATHVWFREVHTWTTGAGPVRQEGPSPLVVTITVPEVWREELSRHAISAVRAALLRHAPGIGLHEQAAVWINVVGVHDGSIGMNGKRASSTDIVRFLTHGITPPDATGLPEGLLIDPVCGMQVRLGKNTITIDHDGKTLAFCATGCRKVYAEDHNITLTEDAPAPR